MIGGGHPRFTEDFIYLMNQITGFESADLYLNFWTSSWSNSEQEAIDRVNKILLPTYKLAKLKIVQQPQHDLPPHRLAHPPAEHGNFRWWHERRVAMWESLAMAYEMIDQDYDLVIRFRPDGMLKQQLDLSSIDLINNQLLIPRNGCGYKQWPVNDQFAIGTYKVFNMYRDLTDNYNELVVETEPDWENNPHEWSNEHLLGFYLNKKQIKYSLINIDHVLTTKGRSKFTDKHYHMPITRDITEL